MAAGLRHSDRAYLALREDIVSGRLQAGQALPEASTAERLSVSRSPVREAVRRLASENLVTIVPGRGAFVATVSLTDILELYQLREVLEPLASRLAAHQRITAELQPVLTAMTAAPELINSGQTAEYYELCARMDTTVASLSGNGRLTSMLEELWHQARRARSISNSSSDRLLDSAAEHIGILQAIIDGDGELAAERTRLHLRNSLNHVFRAVGDYGVGMATVHE
jgi:GntR family transcriptional regulator, rspAB operon transcriptional repressor